MAIAFVQEAGATETATSTTLAVTISTTAGNCLAAFVALGHSSASVSGIADTAGNTWAKAVGVAVRNPDAEIWVALDAAAVTSVTVTASATVTMVVAVQEWSGVATASAVDQTATDNSAGSTAFSSGTTATTTQADEVAVAIGGLAGTAGGDTLTSPQGGWTLGPQRKSQTNTANTTLYTGYLILSATGTQVLNATMGSSSLGWEGAIVTLKGAGAAPTAMPARPRVVSQAVTRSAVW